LKTNSESLCLPCTFSNDVGQRNWFVASERALDEIQVDLAAAVRVPVVEQFVHLSVAFQPFPLLFQLVPYTRSKSCYGASSSSENVSVQVN